MNSINPTKIENVVNTARTVAKDCPQHAKTIEKKISQLSETATSQAAKITKLNDASTKATKSLNSAVASETYKATRNEPFCKIIKQDGQKILVTSSMENPIAIEHQVETLNVTSSENTIKQQANELLQKVRQELNADYIESRLPDVIEAVKHGKTNTGTNKKYYYYKQLEKLIHENPEVALLLSQGSALKLSFSTQHYGNTFIEMANEMAPAEIKQVFKELDQLSGTYEYFEPEFTDYIHMLIMKKYNPETYNYLMHGTEDTARQILDFGNLLNNTLPSASLLKSITPEQLQVKNNDIANILGLGDYVKDSDIFSQNKAAVERLNQELSKHKISIDVEAYRGEKTVGMFDSISIDEDFEKEIRQIIKANKKSMKEAKITAYTGKFSSNPNITLYDFLSSKKTLTLADAMQVAKYGNEQFVNEVIDRINKSKVIDARFKSYSFDQGMAYNWRGLNCGDNTTITQKTTIKQGTEGCYSGITNNQYELVLNNTPKEISFESVVYNKETDTFELVSTIQNKP